MWGVGPHYLIFERTASKHFEEVLRGAWLFGFCLAAVDPAYSAGKFWNQEGTWMISNGDGYWETVVHGLQTIITADVADSPKLGDNARVGLLLHNGTLSIVRGGEVVGDKVITGVPLDKPLLPCVHLHQSKQAVRLRTNLSVSAALLEQDTANTATAAETTSTLASTSSS